MHEKRQLELFPDLLGDKKLLSDLPEFAAEFHPLKNGHKKLEDFTRASSESVWWLCKNGHEWRTSVSNRTRQGTGCPYCGGKLPTLENNLAVANPALCREWNQEKNDGEPCQFTPRSQKEVWWRCDKGHEWQAPINNRNSSRNTILRGCPYCLNKKVGEDNNLEYLHPEMAKDWHPENELKADKVLASTNKKFLWRCSEGHTWKESPLSRSKRVYGCLKCSKGLRSDSSRKATEYYNLQTENPLVCKEWNYGRNERLPSFYMPASNDSVWWICDKGHEWRAGIYTRTKPGDKVGAGCPYCSGRRASEASNLAVRYPEVAKEWHPTNNTISPTQVAPASNKKFWWLCERGHEWETTVSIRTTQGSGCPACSTQSSKNEIRILTELHAVLGVVESRHKIDGLEVDVYLPEMSIAIEYDGYYWHRLKEDKDKEKQVRLEGFGIKLLRVREAPLPKMNEQDVIIPPGTLLSKDNLNDLLERLSIKHEAKCAYVSNPHFLNEDLYREYLNYFPSPFPAKSLASVNPSLAAEWHPTRNRPLMPSNFTDRSGHIVWWQCENGHEWQAQIGSRSYYKTSCAYCRGRKTTPDSCMSATRPDMAAIWHPSKNGKATPDNTVAGSGIKRWWICLENPEHTWQQAPDRMKRLSSDKFCPHCRTERNRSLAVTHPEIARLWHPTKNGTTTPNDLSYGAGAKRWWLCPENPEHEWQISPNNLSKPQRKSGFCPFCSGRRKLRS